MCWLISTVLPWGFPTSSRDDVSTFEARSGHPSQGRVLGFEISLCVVLVETLDHLLVEREDLF